MFASEFDKAVAAGVRNTPIELLHFVNITLKKYATWC